MQATPPARSARQPVHNKEHRLPNLYWRAMHMDSLRSLPRVVALPPVQHLEVSSSNPQTFRYVRQHTTLWADLHQGLVTTGRLKQALGMHEDEAAKILKFPRAMRGSHYLQSAWQHVLQEQPRLDSSHGDPVAHNEAARQAFNSTITDLGGATSGMGMPSAAMTASKKRNCEAAAMGGNAGTRMAWGMVQEAAAAHCLLHIFPHCTIEEVGLYQVDATTQLPGSWAATASQLPAMGASPDAVVTHTLQLTAADLAEASALLNRNSRDSSSVDASSADSAMGSSRASAAAQLLLSRGLSRVAVSGSSGSSSAGPREGSGIDTGHCSASVSLAAPSVDLVLLNVLQDWQSSNSSSGEGASVAVREVVEVKNHSPFNFRHRRRGVKGRLSVNFSLRDRGPVEAVRPEWVPQLQLHMLATGCMSALLVSRSATKGVRVFRLWRDDAYLDNMLALLADAKVHCAANGGVPPPASALLGQAGHLELLRQTVALAAGAVCIADVAGSELQPPPGADEFAFWPA